MQLQAPLPVLPVGGLGCVASVHQAREEGADEAGVPIAEEQRRAGEQCVGCNPAALVCRYAVPSCLPRTRIPGGSSPVVRQRFKKIGAEWMYLPLQSCLKRAKEGDFEKETQKPESLFKPGV